jgi:DnaJ-domain-containing protein 1
MRRAFYLLQIGVGGLFLAVLAWGRAKPRESGFAVREADLKKGAKPQAAGSDELAQARIERKSPLSLPGIRIDGPPHEILGIAPNATADEVQRAYRERMKQYHPDKIGRPGSREWGDAQKIAEAINRAKAELLKNAGRKS